MTIIRVFTLNSNGKIELTKEELQQMLDESYQYGCNSVTIQTPSYPYAPPFYYNTATASNTTTSTTLEINSSEN